MPLLIDVYLTMTPDLSIIFMDTFVILAKQKLGPVVLVKTTTLTLNVHK